MLRVFFRRFVSFCLLFLVLTGCATSTIVNLTPPSLPKSEDGLYRFEASWESNQRSILEESLQAFVVLDGVQYPMEPVSVADHRWEALLPLSSSSRTDHLYQLKFNYLSKQFPQPKPDSLRSEAFSLEIEE